MTEQNQLSFSSKALVKQSLTRILGWLLMASTIGLTSCQAFYSYVGN